VTNLVLIALALEVPTIVALLDCWNREPGEFVGGADDRRSWLVWLWVAVATSWLFIGYVVVLGYYYSVVKRQTPLGRG